MRGYEILGAYMNEVLYPRDAEPDPWFELEKARAAFNIKHGTEMHYIVSSRQNGRTLMRKTLQECIDMVAHDQDRWLQQSVPNVNHYRKYRERVPTPWDLHTDVMADLREILRAYEDEHDRRYGLPPRNRSGRNT